MWYLNPAVDSCTALLLQCYKYIIYHFNLKTLFFFKIRTLQRFWTLRHQDDRACFRTSEVRPRIEKSMYLTNLKKNNSAYPFRKPEFSKISSYNVVWFWLGFDNSSQQMSMYNLPTGKGWCTRTGKRLWFKGKVVFKGSQSLRIMNWGLKNTPPRGQLFIKVEILCG